MISRSYTPDLIGFLAEREPSAISGNAPGFDSRLHKDNRLVMNQSRPIFSLDGAANFEEKESSIVYLPPGFSR